MRFPNLSSDNTFLRPKVNTVYNGEGSLRSFGPIVWNNLLPNKYKSAENLEIFKNKIKLWILKIVLADYARIMKQALVFPMIYFLFYFYTHIFIRCYICRYLFTHGFIRIFYYILCEVLIKNIKGLGLGIFGVNSPNNICGFYWFLFIYLFYLHCSYIYFIYIVSIFTELKESNNKYCWRSNRCLSPII